jgi:hypothetical protein
MAEESAKLRIPYIAAAQAQKHVTHNEGMTLLDTLVQLSVLDKDLSTPPGSPVEGDTYIVAAEATGAWIGWDQRIARYIDGTWRSYLPGQGDGAGWLAYVIDESTLYVFTGTAWEALYVAEGHSGVSSVNGEAGDVTLALDDLVDVDAPSPGDGQVLTWDDGAGEWVPAAPAGGDPVTLEPEGEWTGGATYAKLDVVSYQGSSYVSRVDSNSGNQPDTSPTEWMLLASQGEPGAGAVDSVNGQTGAVSLDAADIPFDATGLGHTDAADLQEAVEDHDAALGAHIANTGNPHGVTKSQVGLGNVDDVQQLPASYLDTDGALAANSDAKIASQKATKTYADLKLAKASNLSDVNSASAAFANIKQAATQAATGVVELATAAELRTGTDTGRVPAIDQIWAAADFVALSDGANIAVDFATGINFSVALGGNRTLSNPTNAKVGQTGTIKVTASGSTRTLAIGGNYKPAAGVESFPISITTSEVALLSYFVESSSAIWITAVLRR